MSRRILLVSHHPVFGGPENQALRLSAPLLARGWETLVALTAEPGTSLDRLREGGVEVVSLPLHRLRATPDPRVQLPFASSFPGEVRALRRLIEERSVDLVLIPGLENPHGAIAGGRADVPVVWQLLGTRTPVAFRRAMVPLVRSLADAVMTAGTRIVDEHPGARSLGDRLVPFFPPVDTDEFAPDPDRRAAARSELGIAEGELVIGNFSNLNAQKDHLTFVRAAARVLEQRPEARFVLLGETSATQQRYLDRVLAEARRLDLLSGDRLQIRAPGARVAELASALDIFWLTSEPRSEGVPTAMLEAMALGIPAVATDVGGVRDVLSDGQGGRVVPPASPEAIAAATLPIAADPELLATQGSLARQVALDRAGIDDCLAAHEKAFELAIRHHRGRRRKARRRGTAVEGSPHLKHAGLNRRLTALLLEALDGLDQHKLERSALDVGAGDGAFVEPLLDRGWHVRATEVSRPSIERLRDRYGEQPSFAAIHDPDGTLEPLAGRRFSLILYASVLHHIPDYLTALEQAVGSHLAPGGALVSIQDPLWYPDLPTGVHGLSEVAFLSWRLRKGNYLRGIRSRLRRARGAYDETNPSDTIEYHVVRQGVDQAAIRDLLSPRFEELRIVEYWSSHGGLWQRIGEALPVSNTFALVARGYRG